MCKSFNSREKCNKYLTSCWEELMTIRWDAPWLFQEQVECRDSPESWRKSPCSAVATFVKKHKILWRNWPGKERRSFARLFTGTVHRGYTYLTHMYWIRCFMIALLTSSLLLLASVASSVSCAKTSVKNFSSSWQNKSGYWHGLVHDLFHCTECVQNSLHNELKHSPVVQVNDDQRFIRGK